MPVVIGDEGTLSTTTPACIPLRVRWSGSQRVLSTILCTDVVDSTATATRIGDAAGAT